MQTAPEEKHRAYVEGLSEIERVLITMRDNLYNGEWDGLVEDLNSRLRTPPAVKGVFETIRRNIEYIAWMENYEIDHRVNLAHYLE